jgi:hypothetical protein
MAGAQLRYLLFNGSRLLGGLGFGASAWLLADRDRFINPGRFEDYARKMYAQYIHLNVPTWIIGPALGEGPLIERPADVLKVWPTREPIQRLAPAQFNPLLDQLVTRHCR